MRRGLSELLGDSKESSEHHRLFDKLLHKLPETAEQRPVPSPIITDPKHQKAQKLLLGMTKQIVPRIT